MFLSQLMVGLCLASLNPSLALLPPLAARTRKISSFHRTSPCSGKQSPENNVDKEAPVDKVEPVDEKRTKPQPARDPSPQQIMAALNTSPRRILLSFASASGIALAANFLGITSRLLEVVPESTVEATGLDTYFPRGESVE
jgi:hypothetical protein